MRIMKVVYSSECEYSGWDGGNSHLYMGEASWQIGEVFNGEFIKGRVSEIVNLEGGSVRVSVQKEGSDNDYTVLWIPAHAVQRVYYGD